MTTNNIINYDKYKIEKKINGLLVFHNIGINILKFKQLI